MTETLYTYNAAHRFMRKARLRKQLNCCEKLYLPWEIALPFTLVQKSTQSNKESSNKINGLYPCNSSKLDKAVAFPTEIACCTIHGTISNFSLENLT